MKTLMSSFPVWTSSPELSTNDLLLRIDRVDFNIMPHDHDHENRKQDAFGAITSSAVIITCLAYYNSPVDL